MMTPTGMGRVGEPLRRPRWPLVVAVVVAAAVAAAAYIALSGPRPATPPRPDASRSALGRAGKTGVGKGATASAVRPSASVHCEFTSLAYEAGMVMLVHACNVGFTSTVEYPVGGLGSRPTTAQAMAAACRDYVGSGADHEWLNTYVAPKVRSVLVAAGGRCGAWLALSSARPPAGKLVSHATEAMLYGGG